MRHDYESREPRPLAEPHESSCRAFCRCIAYPFAVLGVVVVLFIVSVESESPLFEGFILWMIDP